jgi:hypothetical protein
VASRHTASALRGSAGPRLAKARSRQMVPA